MNEQYKKKYLKYKNKYNKFKKKIKGGYTYPAIIGSVSLIALLAYLIKKELDKKKIITIGEIDDEDVGIENVEGNVEGNVDVKNVEGNKGVRDVEGNKGVENLDVKNVEGNKGVRDVKGNKGVENLVVEESIEVTPNENNELEEKPADPPVKSEADLALALSLKN